MCVAIGVCLVLTDIVHCERSTLEDADFDSTDGLQLENTRDEFGTQREIADSAGDGELEGEIGRESYEPRQQSEAHCDGYSCHFRSTCGRAPLNRLTYRARSSTPFMSHGEDQIYGEWPSYALVNNLVSEERAILCGGTVVSDYHILTAAHCLLETTKYGVYVLLGEHKGPQTNDKYDVIYNVTHICRAKRFQIFIGHADYDFAVLTVDRRIQFNNHVQPACLPYGYRQGRSSYKQCHLVGTGIKGVRKDGTKIETDTVQKMRVKQVPCDIYGRNYNPAIHSCFTKAWGPGDACLGDSGGPILCLDEASKRWTVIATVSFTINSLCDGQITWTSAYVRTTMLLPEIKTDCGI